MKKKIICLDFDGVIHSYVSGWRGIDIIPDRPTKDCKQFLVKLRKKYKVVVFSSRCKETKGIQAIKNYLDKYGLVVDDVVKDKPPAIVYIDDRGIQFQGWNDELFESINSFKPYKEN